jgi:hypothetical protein
MVPAIVAVLLLTGPVPELAEIRSVRDQPQPSEEAVETTPRAKRPSLRASVETVVDRRMPDLIEYARTGRLSWKRGLLNIGGYPPMVADGVKAPPLRLFSRPAVGQSLNHDPTTGRSHFWP